MIVPCQTHASKLYICANTIFWAVPRQPPAPAPRQRPRRCSSRRADRRRGARLGPCKACRHCQNSAYARCPSIPYAPCIRGAGVVEKWPPYSPPSVLGSSSGLVLAACTRRKFYAASTLPHRTGTCTPYVGAYGTYRLASKHACRPARGWVGCVGRPHSLLRLARSALGACCQGQGSWDDAGVRRAWCGGWPTGQPCVRAARARSEAGALKLVLWAAKQARLGRRAAGWCARAEGWRARRGWLAGGRSCVVEEG